LNTQSKNNQTSVMHKNYYAQLQDQAAGGRTGMPGYPN
jgi:hypothetical protein